MAITVGDAIVTITGDTSQLDRTLSGLSGRVKKNLESTARNLGQTGRGLLVLSAPLVAIGGIALKTAIDFETAFAGVRKTVDATEAEFAILRAGFRQMAKDIPVSVIELSRIGEAAGQLGIESENILTFTRTMADLGVTTNLSSEEAATALARLANITQLPQGQIDRLGAVIVDLGNNLATTEAEIVTFGLRIAGTGKIAGLTEAQILAIGGAFSSVGVQAEAGGTAVQKVLLNMTEAVADQTKELETFARVAGLSAKEFGRAFKEDAGEVFTLFVEGLGRAGTDAFQILEELGLQDQRLIRSFLSLAGAGDLLRASIDRGTQAWEDNTALTEEAEKRYATAAAKLTIFKQRLMDIGITIGDTLLPPMIKLAEAVAPIIAIIGEWVEAHKEIAGVVIAGAVAVAGLGVALVTLGFILPGIISLVSVATIAFKGLHIAMGPVGLAILAISAAAIAGGLIWKKYSDSVKEANKAAVQSADTLSNDTLNALAEVDPALGRLKRKIDDTGTSWADWDSEIKDANASLQETVKTLDPDILNALRDVNGELDIYIDNLIEAKVAIIALESFDPAKGLLPQVKTARGFFAELNEQMEELRKESLKTWEESHDGAGQLNEDLQTIGETLLTIVTPAFAEWEKTGTDATSEIGEEVNELITQLQEMGLAVSEHLGGFAEFARETGVSIEKSMTLKFNDFKEAINAAFDDLASRIPGGTKLLGDMRRAGFNLVDVFKVLQNELGLSSDNMAFFVERALEGLGQVTEELEGQVKVVIKLGEEWAAVQRAIAGPLALGTIRAQIQSGSLIGGFAHLAAQKEGGTLLQAFQALQRGGREFFAQLGVSRFAFLRTATEQRKVDEVLRAIATLIEEAKAEVGGFTFTPKPGTFVPPSGGFPLPLGFEDVGPVIPGFASPSISQTIIVKIGDEVLATIVNNDLGRDLELEYGDTLR